MHAQQLGGLRDIAAAIGQNPLHVLHSTRARLGTFVGGSGLARSRSRMLSNADRIWSTSTGLLR